MASGTYSIGGLLGGPAEGNIPLDPSTESGATDMIYYDPGVSINDVTVVPGLVITGFHCHAEWSPRNVGGNAVLEVTLWDTGFDPLLFASALLLQSSNPGPDTSMDVDESYVGLGSIPFTVPTTGVRIGADIDFSNFQSVPPILTEMSFTIDWYMDDDAVSCAAGEPERIDFTVVTGTGNTVTSSYILTERGLVQVYAISSPSGNTAFAPLAGENRFSLFTIPNTGSSTTTAMWARGDMADDDGTDTGLNMYVPSEDDNIYRVNNPGLAGPSYRTVAVTNPGTMTYWEAVSVNDNFDGYGYAVSYGTSQVHKLWRWLRSSEPVVPTEILSDAGGSVLGVADNGRVWILGDNYGQSPYCPFVRLLEADGTLVETFDLDSAATGYPMANASYEAFFATSHLASWGDDAIFELQSYNGIYYPPVDGYTFSTIWHMTQGGSLTEITDRVFVNGIGWREWTFNNGDPGSAVWDIRGNRMMIPYEQSTTIPFDCLLGEITPCAGGGVWVGWRMTT